MTARAPSPSPAAGPAPLLGLAVWLALLTGLVEGAWYRLRPLSLDVGPDVVWMAPLAYLPWFLLAAGVVALVRRSRPGAGSWPVAAGVFGFLSLFPLLLLYGSLHKVAALVLALGMAVTLARLLQRGSGWFRLAYRTTLPLAVLAVATLAVMRLVVDPRRERARIDRLGPAAAGAPNVVLLVLDTVRALSMSLYGYGRPTTPELERLAAGGVRFDRAIAPSSWTLPSHASMFTGRLPHELSAGWTTPLDGTWPTLAEALTDRGYLTAGFVANLMYASRDVGLGRGFLHYEDYSRSPGEFLVSSAYGRFLGGSHRLRRLAGYYDVFGRKTAGEVNRGFLEWLERRDGRPFFAFLNYLDAHQPYLPPPVWDRWGDAAVVRRHELLQRHQHHLHDAFFGDDAWAAMTAGEVAREQAAYDGTIAWIDARLRELVDGLAAAGQLENTVVIITSDHGEAFGEHGAYGHGNTLYRPVVEVPLVVLYPGRIPAGTVVEAPVSTAWLPATVLDLLGAGPDPRFPGPSLAGTWAAPDSAPPAPAFSYLARWGGDRVASVVAGRWQVLRSPGGEVAVLDFAADSGRGADLAATPEGQALAARYRAALDSMLAPGGGGR